ncbi:M20/M25/M40 family metallo-hydrolase [Acidicapsa dinghuensis]|uniref:M20/M25/M40 family metallo-hydrolase n=1 Tax=Acidicapsa dinghuensis TaxID=2218256 RepID=A0ABW1EMR9_9BACT|nr:M20/M25/M40 family metallo-hydrolase [Acidicapsa dinghuensis]
MSSIEAADILRELVAISTPSAVSNLPLLAWVAGFLSRYGWRSEQMVWTDLAGVEKANLLVWSGSGERPARFDSAFVCHTDTVPYATSWQGALVLEERSGQLHGCGSCDVKGALACFLAAISQVPAGDVGRWGLILTADEEIGCKGMERLLARGDLRIGSAIVSEPTSLRPGIAGKGYGLTRVTVHGAEAHSAFPARGASAILAAARLIAEIDDKLGGCNEVVDALFDPPRTTWNIGTIEGGAAKNIVAGRCSFLVEWRPVPSEPPQAFLGGLRAILASAQAACPKARFELEPLRSDAGFAPAAQGILQQNLQKLLGTEPTGISFGSEASRLAAIADEVIVIGPGDMQTAHSDRECVPVAELEKWTGALVELLQHNQNAEIV